MSPIAPFDARRPMATAADEHPGGGAAALVQPNAKHHYEVSSADLPLACPMPGMYLWNSHPRVFLPIEASGWAKCPYCSAEYTLKRG